MNITRRAFNYASLAAVSAALPRRRAAANSASNDVVLAIMGVNSRGSQLARGLTAIDGVRIAYICDCDDAAAPKGIEAATAAGAKAPKVVRDFREALDDPAVDALVCAAPNHWHAAATITACAADKHVYVEKPASQTAEEGELMIKAARDSKRMVQVGMQRRSGPLYQQVVDKLRGGVIGEVRWAKSWYIRNRPSIGHAEASSPPSSLDFDLWQGPATAEPYRANILPYNWHWFWHWGNGELGNNGVHTIDICRWAMGVDFPSRVSASGSRLRYDDDQQTPDTMNATFECDGKVIEWAGISWSSPYGSDKGIGIEFRGDNGTLFVDDSGCRIFDEKGKPVDEFAGGRGDREHLENFLAAVRDGETLQADAAEGHKSALFCHLGNIAYRTNQQLEVDPASGHLKHASAGKKYWGREYRPGWMPS